MTESLQTSGIVQATSALALKSPRQTALVDGHQLLDYGSLVGRANQIARHLLHRGVKPEDRVGVLMPRSIDFAIAALGILKSGAAYVALDPSYPAARRCLIEKDAELLLSFTCDGHDPTLVSSVQTLSMDDAALLSESTSGENLPQSSPQQLAYVIYTSGSTGVPKGVEVTHDNLSHLVRWHNRAFQVTSEDHATLLANVGFDAAVWELWPYLAAGATLYLPEPETIRQPEVLRDYLLEQAITLMFAPTLVAEALIQLPWPSNTRLRALLTGGDVLRITPPPGLPFSLINNYGPAECTVVSTSGEVRPSAVHSGLPSLGSPIDGVSVSIVDDQLQEVPRGSAGEILIGGAGVARGYLHQPELTAKHFITSEATGRAYRSGDLGRLNDDGTIQFLGRKDEQVKIRGYRIEFGEIEAAINSLPMVRNSAVVVRAKQDGQVNLAAYLALTVNASPSHQELRKALRALLPDYMVPEQFIRMAEIPVSDNGKLDRSHLPAPDASNIIGDAEHALTPLEVGVKEILKELLNVDNIAADDDFFLLGGHSFIAAQLIARIRDRFGAELGLRAVFENPTVAGISSAIAKKAPAVTADVKDSGEFPA